jgi:hypothetical protein
MRAHPLDGGLHRVREQRRPEVAEARRRARRRVSADAGRVVVRRAGDEAGAEDGEKLLEPLRLLIDTAITEPLVGIGDGRIVGAFGDRGFVGGECRRWCGWIVWWGFIVRHCGGTLCDAHGLRRSFSYRKGLRIDPSLLLLLRFKRAQLPCAIVAIGCSLASGMLRRSVYVHQAIRGPSRGVIEGQRAVSGACGRARAPPRRARQCPQGQRASRQSPPRRGFRAPASPSRHLPD